MSPRAGEILLAEIMPIIQGVVPASVRQIGCEDVEELVQDCIVIAAQMLQALEDAGKQVIIAKSVAYYSIQRMKCGRRSYGAGRTDVLAPGAQLDRRCVVVSLEQSVNMHGMQDDDDLTLGESLACRMDDPATVAGRHIDWNELENILGDRKRTVIQALHQGHGTGWIAKRLQVSAPRVTQIKREIADVIIERWGDDVLEDVDSEPMWRSSLRARELTAV